MVLFLSSEVTESEKSVRKQEKVPFAIDCVHPISLDSAAQHTAFEQDSINTLMIRVPGDAMRGKSCPNLLKFMIKSPNTCHSQARCCSKSRQIKENQMVTLTY